ncbi:MAG: N-acetylmuramoyl-L-alanine amidase [Pseudomonadota bacterium]
MPRAELVVLHYTVITPAEAALERLCDPAYEVSAHYVIGRDGALWQLVRENDRAWHAGAGCWRGLEDINSRSIGIELVNDGESSFPSDQIGSLVTLLAQISGRWGLTARDVIGHSDMAPERKRDPGRRFPWDTLARAGLALGRASIAPRATQHGFAELADRVGYPRADELALLEAFRSRFAQDRHGPLCDQDLRDLAGFVDALDGEP